jgi:hypothetical protein
MKRTLLSLLASVALATAASAATVIDTFTGTVVATDGLGNTTTNDAGNYFGGGNLIGDAFTLVFTLANGAGSSFSSTDPGGYPFFNPPNLITAALTTNGQTFRRGLRWVGGLSATSPQGPRTRVTDQSI